MKPLSYLIIHCTATPEGREVTAEDIKRMHLSKPPIGRGWAQVGYSDIIHLDGIVENLVPYNEDGIVQPREITNGVFGINGVSRHLCYVGGMDRAYKKAKDTRTEEQRDAMLEYVLNMIRLHPNILIAGHNQFDKMKACPSFFVPSWALAQKIDKKNIMMLNRWQR